ncbi:hypothetical protein ACWUKX_03640 [Mesorhizobium sp. f-mel]
MAMLTVEEMPSKLGLELLDSAGQRRLGHAQRRYPEVADFVYLHGSPFPDDSLASAR